MRKTRVPDALRRLVARQARYRCGHCLTPEALTGAALEVEHILPEVRGGSTTEENLWSSCRRCNGRKGSRTHAIGPLTQVESPLFNPRTQSWLDYFSWSPVNTRIEGKSATGRATVEALGLNDPLIVAARGLWVRGGWWPPEE